MEYKRDKRSPTPKSSIVSKVMSANKGKNSKPELALRKELCRHGVRGYRLHFTKIPGNPDIVWVGIRRAIFVHGCFWHRCPTCAYPIPKTNREYWEAKFSRNIARDKRNILRLNELGWSVLIIWECEIKQNLSKAVRRVIRFRSSAH